MLSLFDQGPPEPCPASFNMAAHVLSRAADLADKPALCVIGQNGIEKWSYARLNAAVRGCGAGLLRFGLRPGDRVLMRLGNTPDFPIVFLAAISAGLIPIPTSSELTVAEISRMAVILSPRLIVAGNGISLPSPLSCPVLPAAKLAAMMALDPCEFDLGNPDRPAYIVFTSGTSGRPQAVLHAHRAIWARRMMHHGWESLSLSDRLLHAGSFNWTYTLGTGLMDPWTVGATAFVLQPGMDRRQLPGLLALHDISIFAAAPGIYRQLLKQPLPKLPNLRHGLSAGETLSPALRNAWRSASGTDIHEALGMSECSTFISGSPFHTAPEGCAGYPQTGRRVAILDDQGIVQRGYPGTLAVSKHDQGMFLNYVDDPKHTDARFRGEWFVTGDTAIMQDDGAIRYLGRDDDMMNPGGFRVSPLEVEDVMVTCPGILECAVTEIAVKADTKVIACFYVASQAIDESTLSDFAAVNLARYKQPRIYQAVSHLPRGANAKLNRRALASLRELP